MLNYKTYSTIWNNNNNNNSPKFVTMLFIHATADTHSALE